MEYYQYVMQGTVGSLQYDPNTTKLLKIKSINQYLNCMQAFSILNSLIIPGWFRVKQLVDLLGKPIFLGDL